MKTTGPVLVIDAFWADNKPFPSEEKPNSKIGQIFHNEYSGNYRHLGWMDLVQLKELITKHSISHIVLKNLDVLGKVAMISHDVKVCTAYICNKHILNSIPNNKVFSHCKPLYKSVEIGGWKISENDEEISSRAQKYMIYLLFQTKVQSVTYSTNNVIVTAYFDSNGKHHIISEKIFHK